MNSQIVFPELDSNIGWFRGDRNAGVIDGAESSLLRAGALAGTCGTLAGCGHRWRRGEMIWNRRRRSCAAFTRNGKSRRDGDGAHFFPWWMERAIVRRLGRDEFDGRGARADCPTQVGPRADGIEKKKKDPIELSRAGEEEYAENEESCFCQREFGV